MTELLAKLAKIQSSYLIAIFDPGFLEPVVFYLPFYGVIYGVLLDIKLILYAQNL